MAPQQLNVGIIYDNVQAMDIIGVDLIGQCSRQELEAMSKRVPNDWIEQAPVVNFHYIAETLEPAKTTAGVRISPTTTYKTAPRDLDILLMGGPSPSWRPEGARQYLIETVGAGRVKTVMTTCTGGLWLASSGTVNGRSMTTNRGYLGIAKEQHPEVNWLEQRWVVDGNLWTAGGAQAGIDMIATYILKTFHKDTATLACAALDVQPEARGQFYKTERIPWEFDN